MLTVEYFKRSMTFFFTGKMAGNRLYKFLAYQTGLSTVYTGARKDLSYTAHERQVAFF
jgi:hypothetical protein